MSAAKVGPYAPRNTSGDGSVNANPGEIHKFRGAPLKTAKIYSMVVNLMILEYTILGHQGSG